MSLISKIAPIAIAILIPNAIGFAGSIGVRSQINSWYKDLKKPNFRPPNWVFPVVWPILYTSIGVASYFIYKEGGGFKGAAKLPLTLYAVNLVLNGSWTPVFFNFHQLEAAFYLSLLINVSTLSCILSFWPVSRKSAYLMIPYFLWGAFASVLSYYIWIDNTEKPPKD